jgi:hypothetical protein
VCVCVCVLSVYTGVVDDHTCVMSVYKGGLVMTTVVC